MKKRLLAGLVGGLMVLSVGVALAQPMPGHGPGAQQRQAERNHNIQSRISMQERQIQRGVRNNELNRREASHLRQNLNRIKREHRIAKRDGRLDRQEVGRLAEMLDRNERMIRRMEGHDIRRF